MNSTRGQSNLGAAPPMSRVDWAIARCNWYSACGLLGDSPQRTAEVATYQKSPDPPRAKPHLKWYPLSKPDDDIAATYEQPVATSQRHRYSQRVENGRTQSTLASHQSENEQKATQDDPSTWSRVDWAVARCNWYRACGLLEDLVPPPADTTRYRKSSESPRPKPHLTWYPLSKPDEEAATTYQRSVPVTPPALRRRYCQRVEHARARAMLARYQAEKEKSSKGTGRGHQFVEAEHDRVPKGSSHGGEFSSKSSVSQPAEGKHVPVSTDKRQPSPADAERFAKILTRMKALHPNEYAYFVANRGSLADDGKTWNNWDQPLSWGEDNSVRIRSGAKSDFEILRFVINSIHRAPSYKPWLDAKIKSGAIKPPPEQPPELWSGNSTKAKAQREQWYQYMALAGATPNEVASLQNDVLRHEWFGQGGYVENGVMLAGSATSAFNIKAGGTGGPLMFKSKGDPPYPAAKRGVSGTGSSKSNVRANKAAGDAWEGELFQEHLPKAQNELQPQITLKSRGPSGKKVRVDAMGKDLETGEVRLTDGKASATAPHTPNQKIVYPELETHGGVVVGKGKPPYLGGTIIPPTKVDIIRKP